MKACSLFFPFGDVLNLCVKMCDVFGGEERKVMSATFYVSPKFPKPDIQRVVNILVFRDETFWQQKKTMLPVVLWHDSDHHEIPMRIIRWEVAHDCHNMEKHWLESLRDRVSKMAIESTGQQADSANLLDVRVNFFTHGEPHLVCPKEIVFSEDRKTCRVVF